MHLTGIILGPVTLRIINLAAHESGWLDKEDFLPVALSWQSPGAALLRRGFAFSF